MTRKQEIEEMAKTTASHITNDKDMQVAFADTLRRGAQWADRTMIDKACEWLENNTGKFVHESLTSIYISSAFIDAFRKAMKGE